MKTCSSSLDCSRISTSVLNSPQITIRSLVSARVNLGLVPQKGLVCEDMKKIFGFKLLKFLSFLQICKIQDCPSVCSSRSLEGPPSHRPCRCSYSGQLPLWPRGPLQSDQWAQTGGSAHTCDDLGSLSSSGNTARGGRQRSRQIWSPSQSDRWWLLPVWCCLVLKIKILNR